MISVNLGIPRPTSGMPRRKSPEPASRQSPADETYCTISRRGSRRAPYSGLSICCTPTSHGTSTHASSIEQLLAGRTQRFGGARTRPTSFLRRLSSSALDLVEGRSGRDLLRTFPEDLLAAGLVCNVPRGPECSPNGRPFEAERHAITAWLPQTAC